MAFKIIGVAMGLYATYCAGVFFMQRQLLFPTDQIPTPERAPTIPVEHEKLWLDMPFGSVQAFYLKPGTGSADQPAPLVIFAHGNGDLIDFCIEEVIPFTRLGMGVLMVEYPGYGRSAGQPSQETITQTFVAAYDRMTGLPEVDASRVICYGRSLGGGAVCRLAGKRPTAAMILVSAFTSVHDFASRFLAPGFLVRDRFDNLSAVSDYPEPILIFHGNMDEIVPYAHGKKLAEAAQNAELITYSCGHNDMPITSASYWQNIARFLKRAGIIPDAKPPNTF
ncbi:MAG: alpha/beta hydrolase [Thermodesulfobacteriota bacterium]